MQRYDRFSFKATKTDEGFVIDKPIIGRTGILRYQNADGTERIEYRPPEEAFNADSLASIKGKPITLGHIAMVNSKNSKKIPILGTVISDGIQDGNNIRADITIYNLDTPNRELSCGYTLDLDETPGITPDGERYDAIQRNIRYNHLAVVKYGRAGNARLNMDGNQIINGDDNKMAKVRLDNGIEYECPPEVKVELEKIKSNVIIQKENLDALQGKYDAMKVKADKLEKELTDEQNKKASKFDNAVKERVNMLEIAKEHEIEEAENLSNKDIKIAVIKKTNSDINLDNKSEEYIDGMFAVCKENKKKIDDYSANKRKIIGGGKKTSDNFDDFDYVKKMEELKNKEANAYKGE